MLGGTGWITGSLWFACEIVRGALFTDKSDAGVHTADYIKARGKPDSIVSNMELTLISIIQGVAFAHPYIYGDWLAAGIWSLFTFDLRMIRRRYCKNPTAHEEVLFSRIEKEQLLHVRIGLPAVFAFYVVAEIPAVTEP